MSSEKKKILNLSAAKNDTVNSAENNRVQKRLRIKPQSQFTLYDAKQNQGKHTPFNKKILFYPRKKNKNCNQKNKEK